MPKILNSGRFLQLYQLSLFLSWLYFDHCFICEKLRNVLGVQASKVLLAKNIIFFSIFQDFLGIFSIIHHSGD
jgi:hypothetical protein